MSALGDLIVFAAPLGLFVVVLGVLGVINLLAARTVEDYLVAGRRTTGLATGGSLAATVIGGSSTLGLAGLAFRRGITGSWWLLVGVAGLAALLFFAGRIRSAPVYTLAELIGRWYGPQVRRIAAGLILVSWLGIIGAQTRAAGAILGTFLGGSPRWWSIAAGAVFLLYTVSGGQLSVIRTDAVQIGLILAGSVVAAAGGLARIGGLAALRTALPAGHLSFPVAAGFSYLDLLLLFLVVGSTYLIGPDMLSRVFCSRSDRSARRGLTMAIAILLPYTALVALIGLEARVLSPAGPAESAYPLLAHDILPPVAGSIAAIGLLAAFLSSADTTLLTAAAVVSVDLAGSPRFRTLGSLRLTTAVVGIAAVAVGLFSGGIISSLLLGYTIFSAGLFVPVLAALTRKPLRRGFAVAATLGGGGIALTGKLLAADPVIAAGFLFTLLLWAVDRILLYRRAQRPRPGG
jgi:SSS family solute:Na+ symporter